MRLFALGVAVGVGATFLDEPLSKLLAEGDVFMLALIATCVVLGLLVGWLLYVIDAAISGNQR